MADDRARVPRIQSRGWGGRRKCRETRVERPTEPGHPQRGSAKEVPKHESVSARSERSERRAANLSLSVPSSDGRKIRN